MKFTGRNIYISPKASLGVNVRVGDNTVIYDNVTIGDNSVIANDCVIGEPTGDYYGKPETYINLETSIGANALIRSHSIIYSACSIGARFSCGHRVTIREKSFFGTDCRVGTLSDIQGHATFGDYCRLHSNVHIGQTSVVGNFVFIYPYVVFTNDPTPPSNTLNGPTVGDYSQIAVFSVLLPGIKIGRHCLVGAGSIVGKDVDDYQMVLGNPAKPVKNVADIVSRQTGEPHYPWPSHFDRGLPWEGHDYSQWVSNQDKYKP